LLKKWKTPGTTTIFSSLKYLVSYKGALKLLEMICGEQRSISGGPNEEFRRSIIGYTKCSKSLTEDEKSEIVGQIRVF